MSGYYKVVENRNGKQVAGFYQLACKYKVAIAGNEYTAGMVMRAYNTACPRFLGRCKHQAYVGHRCPYAARRRFVDAQNTIARI
jgi:hypothetical protein